NKTCFDKHVVKGEYDWNYFLFCQFRASYDSGSGDSGSPVFQRHGTLEAKLFGLHHAEETAGPAIRLGGVFSPVSGLKKDLGPIDALRTDGAPKVVITQPLDSSSIGTGTTFPLDLQATYWDEEDGGGPCTDCLVTWSSDVDGALGVSPVQDGLATLHVTVWGQGTRIITAVATDSHPFNADGIDQITVTTGNAPPQIWIVSPASGQQLWNGTEYLFLADSFDDQAFGPLDCSGFQWYLEGQPVGTGCSVPVTPTVNGILGVAVAGTDGQGAPGSDSTWVEVVDPPSGQPPHVEILSPGDNAALLPDQPVLVQGRGDDPDDASPLSYAWVLSGPGLQTTVLQTELA
ncbi:MAG: hypothetical protein KDD47_28510, partial [Acidobacteria bacterium]|nr:hypothetical protein [Acidobacteriota bacterium]